ncbi:MAG: hypothetical protein IJO25_05340 [Clostridia bacterium]|nr:hypothetical protein [Clostridia bacterium]
MKSATRFYLFTNQQPCDIILLINNPFRWKGCYFDVETELNYCNYRYYSPLLCSWISPDSLDYLGPETVGVIFNSDGLIRLFWYVLL